MKVHLFYDSEHDKRMKGYDKRNFKKMPEHMLKLLESSADFNIGSFSYEDSDHVALCNHLNKINSSPFSIILFEQLLDDSHREDPAYQNIKEAEEDSELDEMISRMFGDEINREQIKFFDSLPKDIAVKEKDELAKQNFQRLYNSYHSEAMEVLEAQYKSYYRGFWKKKFDKDKIRLPRKVNEYRRKINLPKPLSVMVDLSMEQQLYFVPEENIFVRGRSDGSYTRYIHSLFGFAFVAYQKEHGKIPTHLLVYDKHNELRFIDSLDSLCLLSSSLGSNYSFPKVEDVNSDKGKENEYIQLEGRTRKELLRGVPLCSQSSFLDE